MDTENAIYEPKHYVNRVKRFLIKVSINHAPNRASVQDVSKNGPSRNTYIPKHMISRIYIFFSSQCSLEFLKLWVVIINCFGFTCNIDKQGRKCVNSAREKNLKIEKKGVFSQLPADIQQNTILSLESPRRHRRHCSIS